ncbi:MAG: hypothetical protein H6621_11170 [Halobacteriovoraceae bacterium]|nr:hypothetical protein [Halobacteriovoraceae bacterium]MCB9095619.1 hypothetical protein [Halobacteriovoraceae bacterium]
MRWVSLFSLFALLINCSKVPLRRRDNLGYSYNNPSKGSQFTPIKKKVALLTLFNETPYGGEDLAIIATEELRRSLSRTRDIIIDPVADKIFGNSKEIYAAGGVKLVQLTKKAKMAGINLVIYGRISKTRFRQKSDEIGFVRQTKAFGQSIVELRMYDVNGGKEIFVDTQQGDVDDATFRFYLKEAEDNLAYKRGMLRFASKVAVRKFVPKLTDLVSKLDWVGRVAKIIGTKIYVNAGRASGINLGDVLKVITEGEEVYDPETGAMIGISQGDVKGTIEIIDYFGPDGAVAILHSGGSVTEGDFVELY